MKRLKFWQQHVDRILNGDKTTTHRLFDDKNIRDGDELEFVVTETGESFARAKITQVDEKKLGELTEEDWEGHEKFSSDKEMYETYSKYYGKPVGPDYTVKIIRFELIEV